jgi:hypothetical protein
VEVQMLGVPVAVDLKGAARFDARQHTHQAIGNPVLGSDAAGDALLAERERSQVAHRSADRDVLG